MNEDYPGKSRSQKKRESSALQKAGEALAALSPAARAKMGLPAELDKAITDWQNMKTHEARRRQMQYIGRLMRESDGLDLVLENLNALRTEQGLRREASSRLEELRLKLLDADERARSGALEEALEEIPCLNRARLVHLVEAALSEREKKRPPRHFRELFRYLRDAAEE